METKVKNFLSELQSIKISMIPMKRIDDPEKKSSLRWNQDTPKPDFGGVYAFWWKGTYQSFAETTKEKKLRFKGPVKNGKPSELEMDLNSGFFGTADNGLTCLYVGK
ncbi:MAG: hypothetical protein SVK08_14020, partial [Halobacteriota archaeon]|nr:hypothetical protein [Halobacteriota archaeon]